MTPPRARPTRRLAPFLRDRLVVWTLADYCFEATHQDPSKWLELEQRGFPMSVRKQFDLGVRAFHRWAVNRREEMKLVPDTSHHTRPMKAVQRYGTLIEQLGLNPDGSTPVRGDKWDTMQNQAEDAAAAMIAGKMPDWGDLE